MAEEIKGNEANDPTAVDRIVKGLQQRNAGAAAGVKPATTPPASTVAGGGGGDTLAGAAGADTVAGGDGADKLTPTEEIVQLRERLAKMESAQQQRDQSRKAEEVTDAYIRELGTTAPGIPVGLLRKVLPVTDSRERLDREMDQLEKYFKQIIAAEVKAGRLQHVNIGNAARTDGGTPPSQYTDAQLREMRIAQASTDPTTLIHLGLQSRRQ